jgi:hypothetical protein
MPKNLICSDCNEMMKIGFIPDLTYSAISRLSWVEGKPEKSFWTNLKNDFFKRKNYVITAYRCERCGAIKLFAESDQPAFQ